MKERAFIEGVQRDVFRIISVSASALRNQEHPELLMLQAGSIFHEEIKLVDFLRQYPRVIGTKRYLDTHTTKLQKTFPSSGKLGAP